MERTKNSALGDRLYQWDLNGCLLLNQYCRKALINRFFRAVSRVGDGALWYALMLALPLFDGISGLCVSTQMCISGMICYTLYKHLKQACKRPRPFELSKSVFKGCAPLDICSFPSGHTMHACCFTWVTGASYPGVLALLLPITFLIATSRMVLGLHYPSDVLAGAGLGITIAYGVGEGLSQLKPFILFS